MLIAYLIMLVFDFFVLIATGFVVFVLGANPWWFLLAGFLWVGSNANNFR
jgi:hypothetical protein